MRIFILLIAILFPTVALAVSLGDESRAAYCIINGTPTPYDPNTPPIPAPSLDQCSITVSWSGKTPFDIPASWKPDDVTKTIQSEMDDFNNPQASTAAQISAILR